MLNYLIHNIISSPKCLGGGGGGEGLPFVGSEVEGLGGKLPLPATPDQTLL